MKKKETKKKKAGAPTTYKKKYCEEIIKFFDIEPYELKERTRTNKDGSSFTYEEEVPNDIPFISAFARKIKVHKDTLYEWRKVHPEFSDSFKIAKDLQKEILVVNGLRGLYKGSFPIFTAKNILGWRDQVDHKLGGDKDNPIQIDVHRKEISEMSLDDKYKELAKLKT